MSEHSFPNFTVIEEPKEHQLKAEAIEQLLDKIDKENKTLNCCTINTPFSFAFFGALIYCYTLATQFQTILAKVGAMFFFVWGIMAPCNPQNHPTFFFLIFLLNLAFATIGQTITKDCQLNYYLSLSNVGLLVAGPLLFYFSRKFPAKSMRSKFDKLLFRSFISLAYFEVWGTLVKYYTFLNFSGFPEKQQDQSDIRDILRDSSKAVIVFLLVCILIFFKRRAIGTIETAYQKFFKVIKRFPYKQIKDKAQLLDMRLQIRNMLTPYKKVVFFDLTFFIEIVSFILYFLIYDQIWPQYDYMPLVLLAIHFFNLWSLKFWPFIGLNSQAWAKFFVGLYVIILSAIELSVPCLLTLTEKNFFDDYDDSLPITVLYSFKKFNQVLCIIALRAVAKNPIKYIKLYPGFMLVNSLSFGYFYFKGHLTIVCLCFELLMILILTAPDIRSWYKQCKGRKACLYSTNNRDIATRMNSIFFTLGYLCLSVCTMETILANNYDYIALYALLMIALIFFHYQFIRLIYLPNFQFGTLIEDEKKEVMAVNYEGLAKQSRQNLENPEEEKDQFQQEVEQLHQIEEQSSPRRQRKSTFSQRMQAYTMEGRETIRNTPFVKSKTIVADKVQVLLTVMKQYTFLEYDLGELQLSSKIKQEIKSFSKQVQKLPIGMASFFLFVTTVLLALSFVFFEVLNKIQGFEGSVILFCAFFLEFIMIVYFFTLTQRNKYGPYSKSVFGITIIWLWILAILPYICFFPVLLTLFAIYNIEVGLEITRLAISFYFILTLILTVSLYAAIAHKRISLHNKELFLIETTNSLQEILKSVKTLGDKHLMRKSIEACLGVIKNYKEKELIEQEEIMTGELELTSPLLLELKNRLKLVITQIVKIRNVEKIEKLIEKYSVELIGKDQKVTSLIELDQKKRLANFEKELNSRKKAIQRRKTLLKKMSKQRESCSKLCKSLVQKVELEKKRKKEKKQEKERLIIDQAIPGPQQNEPREDQAQEDKEEQKEYQKPLERHESLANLVQKFKGVREKFKMGPHHRFPQQDEDMLAQIVEEQSVFMQSQFMLESQNIISPRGSQMMSSYEAVPRVLGRIQTPKIQSSADISSSKSKDVSQGIKELDAEYLKSGINLSRTHEDDISFRSKDQDGNIQDNSEESKEISLSRGNEYSDISSEEEISEIDISKPKIQIDQVNGSKEEENEKSDYESDQDRDYKDSFVSQIGENRKRIRDLKKIQLRQENEPPSHLHFGILYSMMYQEPKCQEYFYKVLFNCFADVEDNQELYVSPDSLAQISKCIRTDYGNKLMQAIVENQKEYDFETFREMLTTKICEKITSKTYDYWGIKLSILKELFQQFQRRYPDIFFSAKFAGKLIVIHRLKEIEEEEVKEVEDQKLSDESEEEQEELVEEEEEKSIQEESSDQEEEIELLEEEKKEEVQEMKDIQVEQGQQIDIQPRPRRVKIRCKCTACKEKVRNCRQNSWQKLVYCCRRMKQRNKECRVKAKRDLKRCKDCFVGCFASIASCFNNCIVKLTSKCRLSQDFKELIENREDELEKDEQDLEGRVSEVLKQKHFGYKRRYVPCEDAPSFPEDFAPISDKVLQLEFQRESLKCNCKNNSGAILFRLIEFFVMSTFSLFGLFYARFTHLIGDTQIGQGQEMASPPDDYADLVNFSIYCLCCFIALLAALLGFIYRKKILEGQMKDLTNQIKKSKAKPNPDKGSIVREEDAKPPPSQEEIKESKCSQCQTKFITLYLSLIIVVFNPVIVKYLLRTFLCNREYGKDKIIDVCYGPRHYAMILFSFICLLIFYPIATIIYPGIVYSKFSRNSKKKAELTYKPTFMLTINGYKLLIGALTPILSKDVIAVSLRLNLNTLMLFGLLWMTIQESPCLSPYAQKGHIAGFGLLAFISLSCSATLAFYKTNYWEIGFFVFTVLAFMYLVVKIIKFGRQKKKRVEEQKGLKRRMTFPRLK